MDISPKSYKELCNKYCQIKNSAKMILKGTCHICKQCNGINCTGNGGTVMELGGKGSNAAFQNNCSDLAKIRFVTDIVHDDFIPDTTVELFGHIFNTPIFAAPIGTLLTEREIDSPYYNTNMKYAEAIVGGCKNAGGLAFVGDNMCMSFYEAQLSAIEKFGGIGIPTIKPWQDIKEIEKRAELARRVGAIGVAMDIDAPGLSYQSANKATVKYRSVEALKDVLKVIGLPVIFKGILSVKNALQAVEAGAYGIIISNHGGNTIEYSQSPCQVLDDIRRAVNNDIKVLADGGIRSGEDAFKLLALGADAVLIGRPYIQSIYGGGIDGAEIYTRKLQIELRNVMRQTNCMSLKEIDRTKIIK